MLFKCGEGRLFFNFVDFVGFSSLLFFRFSRLILLFWFYVLCTTLHVSL